MEIWKKVKDYEGLYEVSNLGNVKSLERFGTKGGILSQQDNGKGYFRAKLSKNDIPKLIMVHRLVAIAFIPNPNLLKTVNHINGNKKDNFIENLEWCTQSDNILHAIKNGLKKYSKPKHCKKVIDNNSGIIYLSIFDASKHFKIDRNHLSRKLNGIIKNNTSLSFLKD